MLAPLMNKAFTKNRLCWHIQSCEIRQTSWEYILDLLGTALSHLHCDTLFPSRFFNKLILLPHFHIFLIKFFNFNSNHISRAPMLLSSFQFSKSYNCIYTFTYWIKVFVIFLEKIIYGYMIWSYFNFYHSKLRKIWGIKCFSTM